VKCADLILINRTYWLVEQTGLGSIAEPLYDFITDI
jgi:hypothetical protein